MLYTLSPKQASDRHVRLSKLVLFVSTIMLVLVLSHIHHKHEKHHRVGGSHSHSHELDVGSASSSFGDDTPQQVEALKRHGKQLSTDDDAEDMDDDNDSGLSGGSNADDEDKDDVEVVEVDPQQMRKPKKSLSNSHSLSHVMKKHFRKHLMAPTCLAAASTLLVAVVGVLAGFSGRSCAAKALVVALMLSSCTHAIGIAQRSAKICHDPKSADMCAQIHKLAGAMLLGSVVHHMLLLIVAIRFLCLCRFVEAQQGAEYSPVAVAGVVCAEQEHDMEQKHVV